VYVKDPRVDPTCAADYSAENSAAISDPSENQVVIGQGQGTANTFSAASSTGWSPRARSLRQPDSGELSGHPEEEAGPATDPGVRAVCCRGRGADRERCSASRIRPKTRRVVVSTPPRVKRSGRGFLCR
jgi:hypothetical protein